MWYSINATLALNTDSGLKKTCENCSSIMTGCLLWKQTLNVSYIYSRHIKSNISSTFAVFNMFLWNTWNFENIYNIYVVFQFKGKVLKHGQPLQMPYVVAFFPLKLSAGFNLFSLHFANVKPGSVFGLYVFEDLNVFSDKDS